MTTAGATRSTTSAYEVRAAALMPAGGGAEDVTNDCALVGSLLHPASRRAIRTTSIRKHAGWTRLPLLIDRNFRVTVLMLIFLFLYYQYFIQRYSAASRRFAASVLRWQALLKLMDSILLDVREWFKSFLYTPPMRKRYCQQSAIGIFLASRLTPLIQVRQVETRGRQVCEGLFAPCSLWP
jgi:hypothetical protein